MSDTGAEQIRHHFVVHEENIMWELRNRNLVERFRPETRRRPGNGFFYNADFLRRIHGEYTGHRRAIKGVLYVKVIRSDPLPNRPENIRLLFEGTHKPPFRITIYIYRALFLQYDISHWILFSLLIACYFPSGVFMGKS